MKAIDKKLYLDRFLHYVTFDTQSSESSETYPSTLKQLELSRYLKDELIRIGAQEVELTEHGYVFATIPANCDTPAPVIGLIAHVDTSPDVSGANVKPVIHTNYQGGDIVLPQDPEQIIEYDMNPELKNCIGHDIITTDGTTLLGADNKAGVAEIMAAAEYLLQNSDVKHGKIRIGFTVDEEVGTGTEHFDVKQFGADYAYTIDGETAGEIEDETFCADTVIITVKGVNVHPGFAKDRMVNGIKIASELISMLPKESLSPETTEEREGYIHPHAMNASVEETEIVFLIRDFQERGLKEKEKLLQQYCDQLSQKYPKANIALQVKESYRNMKLVLDNHPQVVKMAIEAIERAGLKPNKRMIRGGTDGARLSFMGLPTPNIFTGGHNFHSKKEWISVQDMHKAVETIIHLCALWAENKQ